MLNFVSKVFIIKKWQLYQTGQSLAAVSSVVDERDKLPPMFQYGRVETISLAPLQRYRAADSGNSSYGPSSNIIFYYETGGAAFLNTQENYITENITVTSGADVGKIILQYADWIIILMH